MILFLAAAVLAGGFVYIKNARQKPLPEAVQLGQTDNFQSEQVKKVQIVAQRESNNLTVSLKDIKKYQLVKFEYDRSQGDKEPQILPLLAYTTPSTKQLVVAVSICEPCRSTTFHLESDKTITCETCGTKWDMESLKGVSGACLDYPPDPVKTKVEKGKVLIPIEQLDQWELRI